MVQKASSSSRTALSNTSSSIPARSLPTSDPLSVSHHLITTLLNVIRIEREGEVVSQYSIANTVAILSELTDEGPVALPIAASTGPGAGKPTMGVGSGGGSIRGGPVMGVRSKPSAKLESPYTTSFEMAFLKQSKLFYEKESTSLLFECDAPTFLVKVRFSRLGLGRDLSILTDFRRRLRSVWLKKLFVHKPILLHKLSRSSFWSWRRL